MVTQALRWRLAWCHGVREEWRGGGAYWSGSTEQAAAYLRGRLAYRRDPQRAMASVSKVYARIGAALSRGGSQQDGRGLAQ